MAFTQSSFSTIGAPSTNTPAVYSYSTLDAIEVVLAIGYFDDKKFQLISGDLIYVLTGGQMWTVLVGSVISTVSTSIVSPVQTTNFMLEVAKGNIAGHSHVNKFGHNPTAKSLDDVWGGSAPYAFYPLLAQDVEIWSTDNTDDVPDGDGAQTVTVMGLGEDWELVEETVALTGTTKVALDQKFVRLFRAFVRISGANATNAGHIKVAIADSVITDDIGIWITAGHGQTQQCSYTVPAGKSAYFVKGYVGFQNADKNGEDATFNWMLRVNAFGVGGAWLVQGEIGLVNIGTGFWIYEYGVPAGIIPEKSDIRIVSTKLSDIVPADNECVGGYDLVLVDAGY